MRFFETSAKTNQNVNEVFNFLTQEILKNNEGKAQTSVGDKLKAAKIRKEKRMLQINYNKLNLFMIFLLLK